MKKNDSCSYPVAFTYESGCEIAVTFPDLDVATSGVNEDDALLSARELLDCVLFGLEEDGEDIPRPTSLVDVVVETNEQAVLIDVFMPPIRQNESNKAITKTVTIPAWLNARAMEYGVNFSQTLQKALKEELKIQA